MTNREMMLDLLIGKIRNQLLRTRDLLRTGVAPESWGMTEKEWSFHKINKAAGELTRLLELIDEKIEDK